jgi:hypothetical protein
MVATVPPSFTVRLEAMFYGLTLLTHPGGGVTRFRIIESKNRILSANTPFSKLWDI